MKKVYCYLCKDYFYVKIWWYLRNRFGGLRKCFRHRSDDYICYKCIQEGNKG